MDILRADIEKIRLDGFESDTVDNVKHVKVLPYLSIVQSVEGSYEIALGNGEARQTGEGGFFVAPAGVQQTIIHHVNPASGRMRCRWIFLDVEINKAHPLDSLYRFPTVLEAPQRDGMNRLFDGVFQSTSIWERYSLCYRILESLMQVATPIDRRSNQGLEKAVLYMAQAYTKPLRIADLAQKAGMSESNFYASFKKQFGVSPIMYLNHYRLSMAADKLIMTGEPINEIGYGVGIGDPLYFSKLFKKVYGTSPKAYRALYRK